MLLAFLIFLIIVIIIFAATSIKMLNPHERGVVIRLGKYSRTLQPGLNIVIPFLEKIIKIDIREQLVDVPEQAVITKDNVVVAVDAVVYYEVTDPFKLIFSVADFQEASTKLAQTTLRNIIGEMDLDQTLVSRDIINRKLRQVLDEATDKWGVRITRVELKRIDPPADVMEAMHKQMKAEREKRAMILEAEGIKQSAILKAEGEKQAAINRAEGEAEAIKKVADAKKYEKITVADGEAQAIIMVYNSIHQGKPTKELIAIKYIEALTEMARGQATKIFFPLESAEILGSLGTVKEIFSKEKEEKKEE